MKILGRIIIILLAALAVSGAATALVGNSSARFPEGETEWVQDQPGGLSTGSEGFRSHDRFHEGEHDAPSLFGVVGLIQNLVIMGLIVGLVALGPRLRGVFARLTGSFHNIW
jgi:hypothetical protein